MKNITEFSNRSMLRLAKSQTDKRVSEEVAPVLAEDTQTYARKISEKAIEIAKEDGRKTVRKEDIRQAKLQIE